MEKTSSAGSQDQGTSFPTGALYFILLFGVVNLFADMTYEGARSVTSPFLGVLGATGFIVASVSGFGEFLGYALRLVSGRWADRSRLFWPITLAGYIVQMAAVPTLALVGNWPQAAMLILLERIGRATRNPPRDVMLARAGERTGRGWAFGVNEALDQLGALVGPLAIAAILAWRHNFELAFAALAAPAVITLLLVFGARLTFPNAERIRQSDQSLAGIEVRRVAAADARRFLRNGAAARISALSSSPSGTLPSPWRASPRLAKRAARRAFAAPHRGQAC
jgi:MFS family permease